MANNAYILLGQNGGEVIDDTNAQTPDNSKGKWSRILIVTDTVISALSEGVLINSSGLTGITIPAGTVIGGSFTSITLTSGVVVAYY